LSLEPKFLSGMTVFYADIWVSCTNSHDIRRLDLSQKQVSTVQLS
jgi:hypothetical protein